MKAFCGKCLLPVVGLLILLNGCSEGGHEATDATDVAKTVAAAAADITAFEFPAGLGEGDLARLVDVGELTASDFRRTLEGLVGGAVRVWMPGSRHWLLVVHANTNRVSLARSMIAFANDPNCGAISSVFASYAGTREDILPAFDVPLKGKVLPQWFVTREIPALPWLETKGVEPDILTNLMTEVRSVQFVRREILAGDMAAAAARDRKGEEKATDLWAKAFLRNPHDPLLLERLEHLKNNAKGFLEVGKVPQALKCYETVLLINPNDAATVHNFGICLKRLGRTDVAEKALGRAERLLKGGPGKEEKDGR